MKTIFALAFAAAGLCAQTANLSGVIRDSSKALVPAAAVLLRNEETGGTRTVAANDQGAYSITLLPAGRYSLTAQAPGFRASTQTGLALDAGDARVDVTLEPASVQESVTVKAGATVLGTDSAGAGTVITRDLIENMP
jgi:hypothetical protein